jgi:hypothetical protein
MNVDIKLVGLGQLTQFIPDLHRYLRKSEAWTRGRATVDDIVRFLYTGQMDLWVIVDTKTVYGYVITEIKNYPRQKWLVLQYAAGLPGCIEKVDTQMHELLEKFARDAGCSGVEYIGRPGWRKDARKHGYVTESVTYEKYFGEEK